MTTTKLGTSAIDKSIRNAEMNEKTKPYDRDRFRNGGICASLLPIFIGLWLCIYPIVKRFDGDDYYWIMALPVAFSFIFIAPIVAFICVSNLKKNSPINREDILTVSFAKATFANFWVAAVFNVCVLLISIFTGGGTAKAWGSVAAVFGLSSLIQIWLYLLITLPLSFLCAIIFELVARPKKFA